METRIYAPQRTEGLFKLFEGVLKGYKEGRELAWRLFLRDLKVSYTKSALGFLWIFLPPLATAGIWIFLNSRRVVAIQNPPMSYGAFAMCGTMLWSLFAEAIVKPIQRYQGAMGIMTKLNFPREAIALAAVYDLAFSFLVKMSLLVPILWIMGYPPTVHFIPALGFALLLSAVGFSFGLLISPLGLLYTDVSRGLAVALPFIMFLVPVIYPLRHPEQLSLWQKLNPVTPFLECSRSLLGGYEFHLQNELILISITMLLILIVSQIMIRISLPIIVERSGS
jgi:lipopolysaccharide transport system permease protein